MGLDITAYNNTKLVPLHLPRGECCEDENHCQAYAYDSFPLSFRGLADADQHFDEFIGGRCYDVSGSKDYRFHAGSYSGYNWWRSRLRETFKVEDPNDPFYELVHFADNEGTIGPEAAMDLYGDFVAYRDAWLEECSGDTFDYAIGKYDDWLKASELACDHGLIDFH